MCKPQKILYIEFDSKSNHLYSLALPKLKGGKRKEKKEKDKTTLKHITYAYVPSQEEAQNEERKNMSPSTNTM